MVIFEFEVRKRECAEGRTWRLPVPERSLSIGRGLENDLVLTDGEIPVTAGTIERAGGSLWWIPSGGEARRLRFPTGAFRVGPFGFRLRISRRALAVISIGSAFLASVSAVRSKGESIRRVETTFPSAVPLPARGAFGDLSGSGRENEIRFEFQEAQAGPIQIRFTPGNILRPDQVSAALNGEGVGFAPACPGRWGIEARLTGQAHLGRNELRIRNREMTPEGGRWGVRDVYVVRTTSPAAREDPKIWVENARKSLERRFTRTGELWKARQYLDRAMKGEGSAGGSPGAEIEQLKRDLERGEKDLIRRRWAEARAALSSGEIKRAREIMASLRAEFADPSDPRRLEVENAGREMGL